MRLILLLLAILSLMSAAHSFGGSDLAGNEVALGFGFLLLTALLVGRLFALFKLPKLTGYLLTGLFVGPELAHWVTLPTIKSLGMISSVAIGLIALVAGSELDLRRLAPRLRSVLVVSAVVLFMAFTAGTLLSVILSPKLTFLASFTTAQVWTASATLGVVFASLSPAVAIALLSETGSDGPLSDTVLGVVVVADLLIIVAFALMHAWAGKVFGTETASMGTGEQLALEVFGSMLAGLVMAGVIALYVRLVGSQLVFFLLATTIIAVEIGTRMHLDPLITCLTAGLLLQNAFGVKGEAITGSLAPATLPIYAVFFALAGAKLHLADLKTVGVYAVLFAGARAFAIVVGSRVGAWLGGAEERVAKWLPLSLISQAGVSVGLAELLARHFPTWGGGARALILSVVTLNELVGPILLRISLVRSGEAGRKQPSASAH